MIASPPGGVAGENAGTRGSVPRARSAIIAPMDLFESSGGTAAIAARVATLTGITLAVGALVFRHRVAERLLDPTARSTHRDLPSVAWTGFVGALLAALIAPARLAVQSANLSDGSMAMLGAVSSTPWGMAVIAQGIMATLAAIGFLLGRSRGSHGWSLALVATAGLALTPALTGHAIAEKHFTVISVASDWIHMLAAGGWIGTLVVLTIEVRRDAAARAAGERTAALIEAFHHVALVCAGAVISTGVLSLVLRVPHPFRDLWPSVYADVLLWKIAPVAMVMLFGALHGWKGPGRARAKGARQVAGTLLWECIFAAIVLAVTGMLIGTEPPGLG
jgi:putative copper export protein